MTVWHLDQSNPLLKNHYCHLMSQSVSHWGKRGKWLSTEGVQGVKMSYMCILLLPTLFLDTDGLSVHRDIMGKDSILKAQRSVLAVPTALRPGGWQWGWASLYVSTLRQGHTEHVFWAESHETLCMWNITVNYIVLNGQMLAFPPHNITIKIKK